MLFPMLATLLTGAVQAQSPDPQVIQVRADTVLVGTPGEGWTPGQTVAVYVAEARPDPRTDEPVQGLRYAGDARIVWVGPELVALVLAYPVAIAAGTPVRLGSPQGGEPTPAWQAPAPVAAAPPPEPPAEPRPPSGLVQGLMAVHLGQVHDDDATWPQALALEGGLIGDGYDTGAGWGAVAWSLRPPEGPGRVEVRLEGLRGERWVTGKGDEPHATEPAVGYWLLTRVDTAGVGLAAYGVLGAGVDDVGPGVALGAGLRAGHPDRTRIELSWQGRGRMGQRFVLDGRVALRDDLRVGVRARAGTLPVHQGDFLQWRADGALVVDAVVRQRIALQWALGAGGYDLPWRDLGLVADGRVEVRW